MPCCPITSHPRRITASHRLFPCLPHAPRLVSSHPRRPMASRRTLPHRTVNYFLVGPAPSLDHASRNIASVMPYRTAPPVPRRQPLATGHWPPAILPAQLRKGEEEG
ncbi:hypothetical protein GUJ93_ZPchr0005g15561 [Zizania palustris]|uniref:Uncharacterized protein n=1 Tax=Zizania palustris TaxID=103762 RepID=A0A8J5T573_ZIZPA|nr:hypothetical protein GUJ93_ZPchr0005g15561 [Zizania palustris]